MRVIAMHDRANGNAEVGEMWTETKSFDASAPISAVVDWVNSKRHEQFHNTTMGNVRIQIDEEG